MLIVYNFLIRILLRNVYYIVSKDLLPTVTEVPSAATEARSMTGARLEAEVAAVAVLADVRTTAWEVSIETDGTAAAAAVPSINHHQASTHRLHLTHLARSGWAADLVLEEWVVLLRSPFLLM